MLRFANSFALYLLILIPGWIAFFYWVGKSKHRALERFGNLGALKRLMISYSGKNHRWKNALLILSYTFFVLALARPQIGTKLEEVKRKGVDIFVAMDVSLSMKAEDIKPNRLEKAKHEVANLIDHLQGDRIGLIAFAGDAFVQCPLTLDYSAAKMFLDIMDTNLIPKQGTNIGKAISVAMGSFVQKERKHKVLIIITDGENLQGDPMKMADAAEKEGVVIYTVGIGSPQGAPIPLYDANGRSLGYKKDRNGNVVMTKLDEFTLEKIALQTGGKYYHATSGEMELNKIYADISKMQKKELASRIFSQYEDRFQYFLGIGLILLILEMFIPERRKVKTEWKGRFAS